MRAHSRIRLWYHITLEFFYFFFKAGFALYETIYVLLTIANLKLLKTVSQATKHHEISCNMSY